MKTVAVIVHRYLCGGAERITERIVEALGKSDLRFVLFTNEIVPEARARALEVYDETCVYSTPIRGFGESAARGIAAAIAPFRPDFVWLVGDDYDRLDLLRPSMAPGGRIIYHLHSIPFFQVGLKIASPSKSLREKLFHTYSRRYRRRMGMTLRNVDACITLCRGYADRLRELYPADAVKIHAIYNPAPPVAEAPAMEKRNEIVYVGRLSRNDKRVDNLLRIFARVAPAHPDWSLKIIGDGPDRPALEQLARDLNLRSVEFLGYRPKLNLSAASIIAMTSDIEGWGMAMVEGMQQGVVPIAFDCSDGVRELLADGRGILVAPGDFDGYAARLSELMASKTLRDQIRATHPPFLKSLDIETIATRWQQLFSNNAL